MLTLIKELKRINGLRRFLAICDKCGRKQVSIKRGKCTCEYPRRNMMVQYHNEKLIHDLRGREGMARTWEG